MSGLEREAHKGRFRGNETGWSRVRDMFRQQKQSLSEEVDDMIRLVFMAGVGGVLFTGLPAGRLAYHRFLERADGEVYRHQVEGIRASHNAAIKGFLRVGVPMGVRASIFMLMFSGTGVVLDAYLNKKSFTHYLTAGAVSGSLFRVFLGAKGVISGAILGSIFGIPAGLIIMAMNQLHGETLWQKKLRLRQQNLTDELEVWESKLRILDNFVERIESTVVQNSAEEDILRIEELSGQEPVLHKHNPISSDSPRSV
uniref:complex I assembly factor TIMMDC1, mitochondrial isoform X1 n=1 Tax=Myxine glutinosa TaxID=7769 RepID=UPI00358E9C18